jgi:hypothetical protein
MTSPDSILYLTGIWYDLIRKEHHKDRDCHFAVVKRWSYGNRPTYHIEHCGYLVRGEEMPEVSTTYPSAKDAENALSSMLKRMISNERIRQAQDESFDQ